MLKCWSFLFVLIAVPVQVAAQSAFGEVLGLGLRDACWHARLNDVIFVGRPLVASGPGESRLLTAEVESTFRGIHTKTIQLSWRGDRTLDAGQSYVMYGNNAAGGALVELQHFVPVTDLSAQRAIQLFTSAMPQPGYVTVMGVAEVGNHPARPPSLPLTGLRIRLQVGDYAKDLFTEKAGLFSASGIPPGRLELTPTLPAGLKVFDSKFLTYTASADECVLLSFFVVSSTGSR